MSAVVSGQVIEKWSRVPVQGASVILNSFMASTGSDGRFRLAVTPGSYRMRVVHKDYSEFAQPFNAARPGSYTLGTPIVLEPIFRALR